VTDTEEWICAVWLVLVGKLRSGAILQGAKLPRYKMEAPTETPGPLGKSPGHSENPPSAAKFPHQTRNPGAGGRGSPKRIASTYLPTPNRSLPDLPHTVASYIAYTSAGIATNSPACVARAR